MKNLKRLNKIVILTCSMLFVMTGCAVNEQVYTSKSGIQVTATSKWREASEKDLFNLYTDLEQSDLEMIDIGLLGLGEQYFTIEIVPLEMEEAMDILQEEIEYLITVLKEENITDEMFEVMLDEMGLQGIDEFEKLVTVVNDRLQLEEYLSKSIIDEVKESDLYSIVDNLEGQEVTVLEEDAYLKEYKYKNDTGDAYFQVYEAIFIKEGDLYTVSAGGPEKVFEKGKEQLKAMVLGIK